MLRLDPFQLTHGLHFATVILDRFGEYAWRFQSDVRISQLKGVPRYTLACSVLYKK